MMCVKPRGACLKLHALRLLLVASGTPKRLKIATNKLIGIKMILASETSGQKEVGRDPRAPSTPYGTLLESTGSTRTPIITCSTIG